MDNQLKIVGQSIWHRKKYIDLTRDQSSYCIKNEKQKKNKNCPLHM